RGGPQHAALRRCAVPGPRPQQDVQPLPPPGQLPTVLFDTPEGDPFGQEELHASVPGLPLLAGQPLPQRRHQVVVRQLVVAGGEWCVVRGEWYSGPLTTHHSTT